MRETAPMPPDAPSPEFRRPRPPLVRQFSNFTCWAAALESWSIACYPAAAVRQQNAIESYPDWQNENGSLKLDGLHGLARTFGMACEIVTGKELTPEYFAARLRHGPLYFVYRPTPGPVDGHIAVVYASGPLGVDLMDPADGYIARPQEFLRSRIWAFTGWPARGPGLVF